MVYEQFIQIGGIVFVPALKKPMAIVNVIDLSRLLLDDGNCNRRTVNVKNIKLTDLSVKICHGARPGTVKKAWASAGIDATEAGTLAHRQTGARKDPQVEKVKQKTPIRWITCAFFSFNISRINRADWN